MDSYIIFSHQDKFILKVIDELKKNKSFYYELTDFFLSENTIDPSIKELWPNVNFRPRREAICGGLDLADAVVEYNYIDEKILEKYSNLEQIFHRMVDFYDFNGRQFTSLERRNLFYANLNYYLHILKTNNPKLVIFTDSPHSPHDVLFAQLCEDKGVPIIMVRETIVIRGRNFIQKNLFQSPELFTSKNFIKSNNTKLTSDLINYIEKSKINIFSYQRNIFRRNHELIYPKNNIYVYFLNTSNIFFNSIVNIKTLKYILKRIISKIINFKRFHEVVYFQKEISDSLKIKNKSFAIFPLTGLKNEIIQIKTDLYKTILRGEYRKYEMKVENLSKKFIYFPLHYQPEATTYPFAGLYMDQEVVIRMVSNCLPSDCRLVIKEHPDTFNLSRESWVKGSYSRDINFYRRISNIKNVDFIQMDISPIQLIQNSIAIVTLNGQSAIQSVINNKPALQFGNAWYQGLDGIIKISTIKELEYGLDMIFDGYRPNYEKVMEGFLNFEENTFVCDRDADMAHTKLTVDESAFIVSDRIVAEVGIHS